MNAYITSSARAMPKHSPLQRKATVNNQARASELQTQSHMRLVQATFNTDNNWSLGRDLDPRPPPYQGDALAS